MIEVHMPISAYLMSWLLGPAVIQTSQSLVQHSSRVQCPVIGPRWLNTFRPASFGAIAPCDFTALIFVILFLVLESLEPLAPQSVQKEH